MDRGVPLAATAMCVALALSSCGTAARPKKSKSAGSSCAEADFTAGTKSCSGTSVLECAAKPTDPSAYVWTVTKDCAAKGKVCVAGDCEDQAEAPDATSTSGAKGASGKWSGNCGGTKIEGGFTITVDGAGFVTGSLSGDSTGALSGTVNGSTLDAQTSGAAGAGCTWSGTLTASGSTYTGNGSFTCPADGCSGNWHTEP